MADIAERVTRLEVQMDRVEEGVSNFRQFQTEARDFFSRADERAEMLKQNQESRDRSLNLKLGIAALLVAILTLLVGWLTYRDALRAQAVHPVSVNAPTNADTLWPQKGR